MSDITWLSEINFTNFFAALCILLFAFSGIIKAIEQVSKIIGRPVKWIQNKNADHELLLQTTARVQTLEQHHEEDVAESNQHDQLLHDELAECIADIKLAVTETQNQITQLTDIRVSDREQSVQAQSELNNTIKEVAEDTGRLDAQISNLTIGMMELLGDKIDARFSRYVSLHGIPENEVDEFVGIFKAYEATGGNHKRKDKFEYVMNHMSVIPVEVNLLKGDGQDVHDIDE